MTAPRSGHSGRPGCRISLLGWPEDFAAHGLAGREQETADALVALSSGEMRVIAVFRANDPARVA